MTVQVFSYIIFIFFIILIIFEYVDFIKAKKQKLFVEVDNYSSYCLLSFFMCFFVAVLLFSDFLFTRKSPCQNYKNIYTSILWLIVSIIWLLRTFRNTVILKEGIYTKIGKYKWNKIKSYSWCLIKEEKVIKKERIEYYKLKFELKRNWSCAKFIDIEIRDSDKEKVDAFLNKKIEEKHININSTDI